MGVLFYFSLQGAVAVFEQKQRKKHRKDKNPKVTIKAQQYRGVIFFLSRCTKLQARPIFEQMQIKLSWNRWLIPILLLRLILLLPLVFYVNHNISEKPPMTIFC